MLVYVTDILWPSKWAFQDYRKAEYITTVHVRNSGTSRTMKMNHDYDSLEAY